MMYVSAHYGYIKVYIMLYTLNLYSAVSQLYLNKTGRKINK